MVEPALPVDPVIVDRLNTLPANTGLILGKARVIGEMNDVARRFSLDQTGPRGRDFTIKMVWAPERSRALFCGANHGVPHRLNDVWEFDLGALTWVMLYAPDLPRDYLGLGPDASDVEFRDGVLITRRGGPAVIAHTWWGLTYDPVARRMLFMNTWVTNQSKAVEQLGGDPRELDTGPPLWSFTPATRRWEMHRTEIPRPRAIFGGLLEYLPELEGSIWHANNWQMHGTWLYEAPTNTWRELKPNDSREAFERESPAPEQVACYDSRRQLLLVQRHKDTYHFDPRKNRWQHVLHRDAESEDVPFGHDAYAPMAYDPASGHALCFEFRTNRLWAYDPDRVAWQRLEPAGDPVPTGNKRLAYFDFRHGVFIILHDTTVWAYRYRAT